MRNYWGKVDLPEPTKPWRARVWHHRTCLGPPVVETEAIMFAGVKQNAGAKLRDLVDRDGQIIWKEGEDMDNDPENPHRPFRDTSYDEYDAREANERADEEYERTKNFVEAGFLPKEPPPHLNSLQLMECKQCGCLVHNMDQHRWKCGAYVEEQASNVHDLVIAVQRTLGIKPQGEQWQTVSDRLRWINQRLEMVTRELGITQRGSSDAPGGPEAAARAQRTLDDDWAGWDDAIREAGKRIGQAIDRYLKGEK